jgi:hypothetical protein
MEHGSGRSGFDADRSELVEKQMERHEAKVPNRKAESHAGVMLFGRSCLAAKAGRKDDRQSTAEMWHEENTSRASPKNDP